MLISSFYKEPVTQNWHELFLKVINIYYTETIEREHQNAQILPPGYLTSSI